MAIYTINNVEFSSYETEEFSYRITIQKTHIKSQDKCKLIWIYLRPSEKDFAIEIAQYWSRISNKFSHKVLED